MGANDAKAYNRIVVALAARKARAGVTAIPSRAGLHRYRALAAEWGGTTTYALGWARIIAAKAARAATLAAVAAGLDARHRWRPTADEPTPPDPLATRLPGFAAAP